MHEGLVSRYVGSLVSGVFGGCGAKSVSLFQVCLAYPKECYVHVGQVSRCVCSLVGGVLGGSGAKSVYLCQVCFTYTKKCYVHEGLMSQYVGSLVGGLCGGLGAKSAPSFHVVGWCWVRCPCGDCGGCVVSVRSLVGVRCMQLRVVISLFGRGDGWYRSCCRSSHGW